VDPVKISRLVGLANSEAKISVVVDNSENITELFKAASRFGSNIYVFFEVDVGMGRCGVNTPQEVFALAERIVDSSEGLIFEGSQTYEGHLQYQRDIETRRLGVREMERKVGEIITFLEGLDIPDNTISGAGT